MAAGASAVKLLEAGIEALARANVGELEALVGAARAMQPAEARAEQPIARERLRALGRILELTHRNLRLLRGIAEYGVPPGRIRGGQAEDVQRKAAEGGGEP